MPNVFKKMNASRQLAQELRRAIQQGKWLAGAQLPTVRVLANEYKVSIKTIHESIQELVADDLVECRPRQGAYVKTVSQWSQEAAAAIPRQIAIIRPISPGEDPRVDETQITSEIIRGIDLCLQEHGFHPVLLSFNLVDPNPTSTIIKRIDQLRSTLAGAIVFAVGRIDSGLLEQLDARDMPWITVNRMGNKSLANFVCSDGAQCGEQIGRCLALGNVKHALIVGQRTQMGVERIGGIIHGYWSCTQNLLRMDYLHVPDWREGPATQGMLKYLENRTELPQAVVGLGDIISVGVIRALHKMKIRVPEDIGVIGTTGLPIAEYSTPTLTTYQSSLIETGTLAGQMLMELLNTGVRRLEGRYIKDGEIIFRQSFRLSPEHQQKVRLSPSSSDAALPPLAIPQMTDTLP